MPVIETGPFQFSLEESTRLHGPFPLFLRDSHVWLPFYSQDDKYVVFPLTAREVFATYLSFSRRKCSYVPTLPPLPRRQDPHIGAGHADDERGSGDHVRPHPVAGDQGGAGVSPLRPNRRLQRAPSQCD